MFTAISHKLSLVVSGILFANSLSGVCLQLCLSTSVVFGSTTAVVDPLWVCGCEHMNCKLSYKGVQDLVNINGIIDMFYIRGVEHEQDFLISWRLTA